MNKINSSTPITNVNYQSRDDGLYVVAKAGEIWFASCIKQIVQNVPKEKQCVCEGRLQHGQ